MAYTKKTWKDRISQYINRRKITDINTGTTQTVTVARDEGNVTEDGDTFTAANMNDLEDRIDNGFDDVDTLLQSVFKTSADIVGSTVSISAGGWGDSEITIPAVADYTPIAFIKIETNSPTNHMIAAFDVAGAPPRVRIKNISGSTVSAYATVKVLYVKTAFV